MKTLLVLLLIEGIVLCFWMLLICVVGIANGPVGLVVFYEQDVKDRVVKLGLTSYERIKRTSVITGLALFVPMLIAAPLFVYKLNGAEGFGTGFFQMTVIFLIAGLFDRIFIDWYWVGHTKAWLIPGTEDLKPYIPKKTAVRKWAGTLIGFPLISALIAALVKWIM